MPVSKPKPQNEKAEARISASIALADTDSAPFSSPARELMESLAQRVEQPRGGALLTGAFIISASTLFWGGVWMLARLFH